MEEVLGYASLIALVVCIIGLLIVLLRGPSLTLDYDAPPAPERDKTGWNQHDTKPPVIDEYQVRLPLVTTEVITEAYWDGEKWVSISDGFECYFQQLEWREISSSFKTSKHIRQMRGLMPLDGQDTYLKDAA